MTSRNLQTGSIAVGGPEVGPVEVGAQILTAHDTCGGFFDSRAAFYRDLPVLDPLINGRRLDTEKPCQGRLAAYKIARRMNG